MQLDKILIAAINILDRRQPSNEVENILIIHIATSQLKYFIQVTIKLVKQIIIYCHNSNAYYTVELCKSIGTPRQHPV